MQHTPTLAAPIYPACLGQELELLLPLVWLALPDRRKSPDASRRFRPLSPWKIIPGPTLAGGPPESSPAMTLGSPHFDGSHRFDPHSPSTVRAA